MAARKKKVTGCTMLVPGYGPLQLYATKIMFGISIVSSESQSRHRRTMYVTAKTSGSFTLDLVFLNNNDWHQYGRVMLHYGMKLSRNIVGSPCRVLIPSVIDAKTGRGVDRTGIPESPIQFGDDVGTVAHRTSLRFLGTSDAYNPGGKDVGLASGIVASEFAAAVKRDPQAAYYYPTGTQLTGKNYGVDTLYDSVPGEVTQHSESVIPPRSTRGGHQEF